MAEEKKKSNKSENKKAIKAGLGYTIGNIFVNGIAFISVPIFTRIMSTSDFGIYSSFMAYQAIFAVILGLCLHTTLKNAKYDYANDVHGYNSSVLLLMLIFTSGVFFICLIFQKTLSQWLSLDWFLILPLILYSAGSSLLMLYNASLLLEYRYKEYLIISLLFSVGSIILAVFLILFCFPNIRYVGRIWGGFVPMLLISLFIVYSFFKKERPRVNKEYWHYGLKISLPIIPHGLAQLLLTQFDRIMILRIIGSSASGVYSFAYTIATILLIIYNSLDSVWNTWFFEMMDKGRRKDIKSKSRIYILLVSLLTFIFFLAVPEVIEIFSARPYWPAKEVVIPIGLGLYFFFLCFFPSGVESYYKKTIYIAIGTVSSAIINVTLNLLLIPKYGYVIAAYTTLASYILYFIFHLIIAYMLEGEFVFDIKAMVFAMVCTCCFGAFSLLMIDAVLVRWTILSVLLILMGIAVYRKRKVLLDLIGR